MQSIKVTFPLCGEWWVATSPADRVPSHYTHRFAMTYAYDFTKSRDRSLSLSNRLFGKSVSTCESWKQIVKSPCDGEVISSISHVNDRTSLSIGADYLSALRAIVARSAAESLATVFGNHVILKSDTVYFLLAHLKCNSTTVHAGQSVAAGQPIAAIGHNGSSLVPHLHFQAMDGPDPNTASGRQVSFDLEVKTNGEDWESRAGLVPTSGSSIRSVNQTLWAD